MKKRILAVLLGITMVLALFSGCGGQAPAASSDAGSAESASVAAEPQQPEEPAEESVEEPASDAEEVPEEPVVEHRVTMPGSDTAKLDYTNEYSMPLSEDGDELTIVRTAVNLMGDLGTLGITTYNDFEYIQMLEELTGVHVDFQELDFFTYAENINLIVASGDFPDIFQGLETAYSTGLSGALNDEVIIDLTDDLAEYAPNYDYMIHSNPEETAAFQVDGSVLCFMAPYDSAVNNQGLVIRKDWLDECGLEVPETYDELHEALTAFKNKYGCTTALYMNNDCTINNLAEGFNIYSYSAGGMAEGLPYYQENGVVKCSLIEDGYRDYLTMLNNWYNEGLMDSDFISVIFDPFSSYLAGQISSDQMGVWCTSGEGIDTYTCEIACLPSPVQNAGDNQHITELSLTVDSTGAAISTGCENPELAMQWMDYWYSEDGILLLNYGIEGKDFTVNEAGVPEFTDVIVNNEFSMPVSLYMRARCAYGCFSGMWLRYRTAEFNSDRVNECWDVWTANLDGTMAIPSYVSMTSEEKNDESYYATDIMTYANQMVSQFVIGAADIDSQWDEYVKSLKDMGIETCIELEQQAYDRAA